MALRREDPTTLPPAALTSPSVAASGSPSASVLFVLFCRDEPWRVGQALVIPHGSGPYVFGRGEVGSDPKRIGLVQRRPGGMVSTPPLACPRISREQVAFTTAPKLVVESLGRAPMAHNGRDVRRAEPWDGDVIELQNELLLLVTTRSHRIPLPPESGLPLHPFGQPDAAGILGEGDAVWALRAEIAAVARLSAHVLVQGESGSGKELCARAIHQLSSRGKHALVARSAATVPEGIIDAELFGNLKNYPNPGTPERAGLVGEADGSTLFLDEIGELAPALQTRLLRVMDQGEYQRLGEATARRADVRIVGATNRDASSLAHDVLARFTARITVPRLDERREDIPLLARALMRRHAASDRSLGRFFHDGSPDRDLRISPSLLRTLVRHRYTTHVRELDLALLASATSSMGKYLELTSGVTRLLAESGAAEPHEPTAPPPPAGFEDHLEESERKCLVLLRKHGFRPSECARDPEYPGNRQTADFHLRRLICKALLATDFSVANAAALLAAGGDRARVAERFHIFLDRLEQRTRESERSVGAQQLFSSNLAEEWRGSVHVVERVVDAIRRGEIKRAR